VFSDSDNNRARHFAGKVDRITFGSEQYEWHQEGISGHADPDGPPVKSVVPGGAGELYELPQASITVLRSEVER